MKKVLILSLAYFPKAVGGAEVSIKEITDRMPDIEFHMVTNRFDSTLPRVEKVGNVLVHRIGIATTNPSMADLRRFPLHLNKLLFQFLAPLKAQLLHRSYRYDAVWAMTAHAAGIPGGLFKMFNPDVKYVLNLQEGDSPEHVERVMWPLWPLFTRAFTTADLIQPLSTFLAKWAQRRGFAGPIEIIPNAVDTAHFSREYPEPVINEIKDRLGKKMGDVFLVTTSRLVRKNAVDDVIRALPTVSDNVHFVILGTGPDETMLKKLTADLKMSGRVHFLGHIGHDDLPKYLKACDIFIRPSRSEGFGASFAEAMAAGLPIIATQEGGIADFLFDEKRNPDMPITGWAVDKDSPKQIAEAIRDIMGRPEKVRAVVATAKQMVKDKYDWDIVARMMREKVFRRLLG
ncbi:MAG TPA: glycosyltransferase [Candidatus Paceibacterota bacterium]|nr:glycosyltransferase [Candidatus Paceibacterota bacterium]